MGLKSKRPVRKGKGGGKKKEEEDAKTVSTESSEGEGLSAADQLAADGIIATYSQVQ